MFLLKMPSTDNQSSFLPFASFGRSILRRDQIHTEEETHESNAHELEIETFKRKVADQFNDLSAVNSDELLSLSWIRKLLDAFLCCQEEFRVLLINNKALVSQSPLDRLVAEFFERSVKALDICNATRDGTEKIHQWQKLLEIVLCALDSRKKILGEGHFRRARKALTDLAISMLDEKDHGSVFSHGNRSFGRHQTSKDHHHNHNNKRRPGHSRSLSWSVSHSWSASKQLQSIASNLVAPRGNEIGATCGLSIPVYTMSCVLTFVLWALVAAIPCQDRGVQIHFSIPRQFSWGNPILSLQERILEESKKRERRNSSGLLREIYLIEKSVRHLTDLVDSHQCPPSEELKKEVELAVNELTVVCDALKTELDPFERQVREMFRKVMNCRTEGLEFLGRAKST